MNTEPYDSISEYEAQEKPMPRVSIGMPVYNGEKFLRESVDALLAQSFTDFELIISDNCSTDGTGDICLQYAKRDTRIRYLRQKENIGATSNFQYVLGEAVGTYFMWAAVDDLCEPTFIECLVAELEKNDDMVLAVSDVQNIDSEGKFLSLSKLDNIRVKDIKSHWSNIRLLFFENPTSQIFFSIYGLFKSSVLRKISLNCHGRVKYASGSEIPLLAQIATLGKIGSIDKDLKIYRRHNDSVYHQEQKNFGYRLRVDNHININLCLINIALRSDMKASAKARALLALARTSSAYLSRLLFLYPLQRIFARIRYATIKH